MPVRKFRSVEEMGGPIWFEVGDPALFRALRQVWGLAHRTLRPRFPPGVHKHRSIDDMNRLQECWDDANFRAYHERREEERAAMMALAIDRDRST
jgi:hypothetical protein